MYHITVFPDATLKTGTGDDKRRVAPHATIGVLTAATSFEQVVELASRNTVSLNEYSWSDKCHSNQVHRHGNYFVKTNLIGLDVDDNIPLTAALEKLRALGWKFGVYTSFNHTAEANKFRVILELDGFITDPTIYRNTWESVHTQFLGLDISCKDVARLYFHSNPETRQVFVEDGSLVPIVTVAPVRATKFANPSAPQSASEARVGPDGFESITIRAKLPIEVRNWLAGIDEYGNTWTPQPGERSGMLYKLALLCKERGYDQPWCDEKLGKRLRDDEDYLANYGGRKGVNSKIDDTLNQVFARDSRHAKPILFTFSDLDKPREFVTSWLSSQQLEVNRNGIFYFRDKTWSPRQLLNTVVLDYDEQYRLYNKAEDQKPKEDQRKVRKLNKDALEAAISEYVDVKRNDHKTKLMEAIKFCGDNGNLSELRKFVKAITGNDDEACLAVLAHFIWQVKRKVFGFKVQYHMMPILTGRQENGKSTGIRKLLKPLEDFITTPTLADLADRRHYEAYQFNYVVFCDEMEQAERADIDGLKNFITAERQTAREMYSTTMLEFRQNCTPIGCSNKSLATLIHDPTGMRRFYEIATDPNMPTNGWKLLEKIDYLKMWQQVDENIPGPKCYIMSLKDTIEAHQEQLRVQDPIELFLDESGAKLQDGGETLKVKSNEFYADYKMFCARNGHKSRASNWFGTKLKEYGIEQSRRRIDGRLNSVYLVNATYTPLNDLTN